MKLESWQSYYIGRVFCHKVVHFTERFVISSGVASLGEGRVLATVLPLVGYFATKLYTLQNDLLYLQVWRA